MKADYPGKVSYSRLKWETLASFWHPVACTSDVGDERPVGAVLLDVPMVLYRIAGQVTAALDRCPHRGEERYGLTWVRLVDNPGRPLPDWSDAGAPGNQHALLR